MAPVMTNSPPPLNGRQNVSFKSKRNKCQIDFAVYIMSNKAYLKA